MATNLTQATAIDLGALPVAQVVDPEGATPLWYAFTPVAEGIVSVQACTPTSDNASYQVWLEPAGGGTAVALLTSTTKQVANVPVTPGRRLFVTAWTTLDAGHTFTLTLAAAPTDTVQTGDLLILNDNHEANLYDPTFKGFYQAIWYTPTGTIRALSGTFPGCELGVSLASGRWGVPLYDTGELMIYAPPPTLARLHRVTTPLIDSIRSLGTDFTAFYVIGHTTAGSANFNRVYKVSADGVVDATSWTLPYGYTGSNHQGNSSCGVSRAGTVLYYNDTVEIGNVRRHDLMTDAVLPPFNTTPSADHASEDIIVLSDDTIVVAFYRNVNPGGSWVYHYAADGTVLHTYNVPGNFALHHLTHAWNDAATHVWIWVQAATGAPQNVLQLLRLADGALVQNWTVPPFIAGLGPANDAPANCDAVRYGAAHSCPLTFSRLPGAKSE